MRVLVTGGSGFIGTNFINYLLTRGHEVRNIDCAPPQVAGHKALSALVDVTDRTAVLKEVRQFQPTHIVHLAALATFEATLEVLLANNVGGTAAVLDAVKEAAPDARILVTSTQYVNGPGAPFDNDTEYHTVNDYGVSKMEAEKLTHTPAYDGLDWVITRPTNIWGPFHPRFPVQIWKFIRYGLYFQPGENLVVRAYGYVENVNRQMNALLIAPLEKVHHRVFYLTDAPVDSYAFNNEFSLVLRNKPLRHMPYGVMKLAATVGDVLKSIGLPAPFFSDRLSRMTADHYARYESLLQEMGCEQFDHTTAVRQTAEWLHKTHPNIYPVIYK